MNNRNIVIILMSVFLFLSGCGFKTSRAKTKAYVRENVSMAHIQTVAVFPFQGGEQAPRIREFTITQLLASNIFDVVDKGQLDEMLRQEVITPDTPVDSTTIRRIGNRLQVQGFIFGSVDHMVDARGNAKFPVLTVTLRLLDTETGQILWQASGMGSGYSYTDRLFGLAPKDTFSVTMDLLNELFDTMALNGS